MASAVRSPFYVVVVAGASGSWEHLTDQMRQDWYFLVPTVVGFRGGSAQTPAAPTSHDKVGDHDHGKALADTYPHTTVTLIERADHGLPMTHPQLCLSELRDPSRSQ